MKKIYRFSLPFFAAFIFSGCGTNPPEVNQTISKSLLLTPTATQQLSKQQPPMEDTMTVQELIIEDLTEGSGNVASKGATIQVHYSGTLLNGTKFDSSYDRRQPFTFTLGAGRVIAGWDQGLEGMKVGGKRKLTIPARLAYGDKQVSPLIPPNSPLVFEVELLGIE